jgi:hypothetical protein
MYIIGVDESEGQCLQTFYLYPRHLFYLACSSSHLYGTGLSFKLLNLYSKLYLEAQGIFKAVVWASSRLTSTTSRLGLYYKLPKGGTLCLKVLPQLCDNFLKASTT